MEDEGEIYDGIRAQFPLTFGKKSKPQTSLEAIHNTTRRSTTEQQHPTSTESSFPSLSSSSKAWLNSVRPNPNPNPKLHEPDVDDELVGPPLPPPAEEEDDGPVIGPPRPPLGSVADDDDDEKSIIGPPRPPEGFRGGYFDEEEDEEEEEGTRHRIPMSNEIVLKGHNKVME